MHIDETGEWVDTMKTSISIGYPAPTLVVSFCYGPPHLTRISVRIFSLRPPEEAVQVLHRAADRLRREEGI